MTTQIATMTMAGETFDVEVMNDFDWGNSEVVAIACYPFLNGASHAVVRTTDLFDRRDEQIPDDLPIPADPAADAPVDVTDEMDADLTRVHLQAVYEGVA